MKKILAAIAGLIALLCLDSHSCYAWDYEGHRIVNQLALASLNTNFPAFVLAPEARERIAFLAGEPDRWRNMHQKEPAFAQFNGLDHYIDIEQLEDYGLDAHKLTHFRYDFTAQLALARAAHPDKFPAIDASANSDHTRELVGFLPWAIVENFDKLKSEFSYLKTFEASGGTPEEIENARQNILYIMGVMGHYVGDAAQPLHTTKYHHGWEAGNNPHGYTIDRQFHGYIDGGFFRKIGGVKAEEMQHFIRPARLVSLTYTNERGDTFAMTMDYILEQFKLVEPLYQLEKAGKLSGQGDTGPGKEFLMGQMVKGGQMLGDLWYTAWQQAPMDTFLQSTLVRRKLPRDEKH